MFSLKNKKAIITGAGSGIGKAIAVMFASQGAEVHIIELTEESAKSTLQEIADHNGRAYAHNCNVANQEDVVKVF
ncbi:MAG: SDR family NAD(P)-dependent oxidoreductase, partial [Ginsengibacter sp.]